MHAITCPHCGTQQSTLANIGDQIACARCRQPILLKPLATAPLATFAANLANITMFLVSLTAFLIITAWLLFVAGCFYTINT